MKILVAPDSFKGSLEAYEICNIVEDVANSLFKDVEIVKLPMADGGEGTVVAVLNALNGTEVKTTVSSPDFRDITATYGIFNDTCAIMEMAEASGITKVLNRDIFKMNTYGTGQMVLDAINRGVNTIYIGIGGSATNDCGLGFASALGVNFLDKDGNVLQPIPQNFELICDIDTENIDPRIKDTKFIIMSDVKNPLVGKTGASHVFGKQKGASPSDIEVLERGMIHMSNILLKKFNKDFSIKEGAGAAGGLGAGLLAFTNSQMQSGVMAVLEIVEFEKHLKGTDLVITGEGRMDYQSAFGKVAFGVGTKSKEQNIPCVAIVGGLGERYQEMYNHGINSIITTVDGIMELDYAIENAHELCKNAVERMFRFININL